MTTSIRTHVPFEETAEAVEQALDEMRTLFPSIRAVWLELFRILKINTTTCKHCEGKLSPLRLPRRWVYCLRCGARIFLTAGTFLHGTRKPRLWLAAFIMQKKGIVLTSNQLSDAVSVTQSTAFNALDKIAFVIKDYLSSDIEVPTGEFKLMFCKHSAETPARGHPRDEQLVIDKEEEEEARAAAAKTSSDETQIQESVGAADPIANSSAAKPAINVPQKRPTTESQVKSQEMTADSDKLEATNSEYDDLASYFSNAPISLMELEALSGLEIEALSIRLSMMEIAGAIRTLPGNYYLLSTRGEQINSNKSMPTPEAIAAPSSVTAFTPQKPAAHILSEASRASSFAKMAWTGTSRKRSQFYLGLFRFFTTRDQLPADWLSDICSGYKYVWRGFIRAYKTPPVVRFGMLAPK